MAGEQLTIGEVAERTGVATSALRFYEAEGLLTSTRTTGGQRRYERDAIRRVSFIRIAQHVGIGLDEVRNVLASLPAGRTPTRADWAKVSRSWGPLLDARIATLQRIRGDLASCIGCGCLSLQACALYNPADAAAALGAGPRYLLGDRPRGQMTRVGTVTTMPPAEPSPETAAAAPPIRRHALFDFGGPLLLTPFELNERAERSLGVAPGSLGRGPFDPDGDPRWKAWQAEEITEREYWQEKAAPFGLDIPGLMRHFFEPSGNHLVRAETWALVGEVQAAGRKAGLLTNDLSAFHGPEWREPISVLRLVDPLVDLSRTGHLKPHPKAYEVAIAALGVPPDEIAFLDDQPCNVEGATRAGIASVWFDPTDPSGSVARFRVALAGDDQRT